ncbi:MAG: hypothetical protein FJZ47_05690 [Candidatus Tectomicrobia bacterium]|uniref:Uncharacterized protein n=1 Tax=Tectimicrobiota bacterium TaxID=2528274 RepID=A0A937W036_UNCTE|nr:hypothetical protein [Candidatus Tectomicrobia bacterium]
MTVELQRMTGEIFEQLLATHRNFLYQMAHRKIVGKGPTEEYVKIKSGSEWNFRLGFESPDDL